ncbi:MAG: metallophosphoesterase, partial [Gammaproteobacteria bacterium]|nr:metallophosphoesterase [Gammaproteobacteria bacterium]
MIAHLTDLHIGEAGERPKGVPVRENFLGLLEEIQSIEPELLVVTGDLSLDTGSREAYRWIRGELDRSGLAYLVMGGNHDDPVMLAEEFGDAAGAESSGEGRYHRHLELGGEELLLLDIPGGTTTPGDVAWLVEALDKSERDEVLLFMHYPPIPLPVACMERHYTLRARAHLEA